MIYTREVLQKRLASFLREAGKQASYANFAAIAGDPHTMEYMVAHRPHSAGDAVREAKRLCSERYVSCQLFTIGGTVVFGLPRERIDAIIDQYERDVTLAHQPGDTPPEAVIGNERLLP
jgi:hypothetical protein